MKPNPKPPAQVAVAMAVVVEIEAAEVADSNLGTKMSEKRERSFWPLPFFIPQFPF